MKRMRRGIVAVMFAWIFSFALAQVPHVPVEETDDLRLPNGKSQRDEILKAEHEQNLRDAAKLADLADELKQALEKEDRFVLSLNTIKKTEDIEKLAKKIRARLRHE